MTDPKQIAFYLRVSRTAQDFPSQLHAVREFCRRHGWRLPPKAKIFAEKITGKVDRRTQLDALLTACRNGHVDTIICYAVDRMGNDARHLHNLIATLDALKIRVIGVVDTIDTATQNAATNLMRNMLFAFSQAARERIGERTIAGLTAARARGRCGGRPNTSKAKIARARKLIAAGRLARPGDPGYNGGGDGGISVKRRKQAGKMSLRELAKLVGLDPGYLSRVLRGKR